MKIILNLVACVCCCLALVACESSQDVNAGAMSECGTSCESSCCGTKKCGDGCAKDCCAKTGAVNAVNPGAVSDQTCPYSGAKMGAMSEKSSCCPSTK